MDELDLYWKKFLESGRPEDYITFFSMREAGVDNPSKEDLKNAYKNNGDSHSRTDNI